MGGCFFFQAEDGIRDLVRSRGLGDVYKRQILSIVSMIIAIVVRTLDVKKIGCDPLSIFQGHALWHLLTGMGGYFMYLFYRSEKSFK